MQIGRVGGVGRLFDARACSMTMSMKAVIRVSVHRLSGVLAGGCRELSSCCDGDAVLTSTSTADIRSCLPGLLVKMSPRYSFQECPYQSLDRFPSSRQASGKDLVWRDVLGVDLVSSSFQSSPPLWWR